MRISVSSTAPGAPLVVPGHEISGVIEEFGSEADAEKHGLKVGDFVVVYPWCACDKCPACADGVTTDCDNNPLMINGYGIGPVHGGGYATHVAAHTLDILVKVPEGISREVACMMPCSALTAYTSLKRARPYLEKGAARNGAGRLLIAGMGGLGLWATLLAKLVCSDILVEVTAADVAQEKLDIAKKYGADFGILWKKKFDSIEEYMSEVQKTTNNNEYTFDAAIDFVGVANTFNLAYRSLRRGGTIICVGLGEGKVDFFVNEVVGKALHVQGNLVGTLAHLKEMMNFLKDKNIQYPALELVKLDDAKDTLDRLKDGKIEGRAVITLD